MPIAEALVRKDKPHGFAHVVLEVLPSQEFGMTTDLASPASVRSVFGGELAWSAVQAACYSGIWYSLRTCRAGTSRVVLRRVDGETRPQDVEGFAAAAAIAVARAVGAEHQLPVEPGDPWQVVPDGSVP